MKNFRFIVVFFGAIFLMMEINAIATSDKTFKEGKDSWLQHDYQAAYDKLSLYWDQPFGKTVEVAYMLGTSGCRLKGKMLWGKSFLEKTLYDYQSSLSKREKTIISNEINICKRVISAYTGEAITPPNPNEGVAFSRGSGSFQEIPGFFAVQPTSIYPIQQLRLISQAELASRIISLDKKTEAMKKIQELVPSFNIYVTQKFIIASDTEYSSQEIERFNKILVSYLKFIVNDYHVLLPENYITIYLINKSYYYDFINLANRLHGLYLVEGIVSYSYPADQSIFAYTYNRKSEYGNILHEFFHLLVRSNFGNISQWLDEGIASLYEEFVNNNKKFLGVPNWRGSIIKEYLGEIPKLETVIKTDWFDESNEIKLPIYSAIARYFTLYMQNLGVLKKVYQSFSDHSRILTSRVNPRNQAIRLIELAFHKKITEIQVDFNIWLSEIIK